MYKQFRRYIPQSFRTQIKKTLGLPTTRLHSDWTMLSAIGPKETPHVVLDIGSHAGWFFHCWKDWCPQAEIHAFEPLTEILEQSRALYDDPLIHFNNVGVSDEAGTLDFFHMQDSKVSSSFLPHDQKVWSEIDYHTGDIDKKSVAVVTIDDYCKEHQLDSIYLMKIDVQGFEMRVLRGAVETLKFVDHILVESGIKKLYHNAPLFTEVVDFLTEQGFHLMTLRAWHRGNHALVETDMLFRRDDLTPQIDNTHDRYCLELKPTD